MSGHEDKTEKGSAVAPPESTRRPEVIVEFLFARGVFLVAVNNIGDGAAYNVSVKFDKKLIGLGGEKEISALALFKNIEFLGPKREIRTLLDATHSYFDRKQPTKISASIAYRDSNSRRYETTITHDLEIYRDLAYSISNTDCCD